MNKPDAGFDYDRYRKLLADAVDEPKRLALIDILIEERARDNLARHALRNTLAIMGINNSRSHDEAPATKPLADVDLGALKSLPSRVA